MSPDQVFPITKKYLPENTAWPAVQDVPGWLATLCDDKETPPFLPDLAKAELIRHSSRSSASIPVDIGTKKCVNPTLELAEVSWTNLPEFIQDQSKELKNQDCHIAAYQTLDSAEPTLTTISNVDLLAMKIIAEKLDKREVAREANISISTINAVLEQSCAKELIYLPSSGIRQKAHSAEVFTLQWHLTQKCDLNCRHCYDRSSRNEMTMADAVKVLEELYTFCEHYNVSAQVSFSGGNPLLYKHFLEIYKVAADLGFMTAILGNPTSEEYLHKIISIQKPEFYQVSLEGLRPHNDYIRGTGYFDRVLDFLEVLKEKGVYSMVMLTLTKANVEEVLPLVELLGDRVDLFNFNRLATVGEGAALDSVPPGQYQTFLEEYRTASLRNTALGLKDNLFNILQDRDGKPLTGGCTGFGCGAAFNFVSLLPDGEVHACRKFPSRIGSIYTNTLVEIYDSKQARKYRQGSSQCEGCRIRDNCGGCAAVSYGRGHDIFTSIDPYCFIK